MFIKIGDRIKTAFCTGIVTEVLNGKDRGWKDTLYFALKVTSPRVHWSRNEHIVRIDEIKAKL